MLLTLPPVYTYIQSITVCRPFLHIIFFRRFDIARPIDLFQALQNASLSAGALSAYSNFSLIEYYQSWTEQSGHPILKVQVNHTTGEMIITQVLIHYNTYNLRFLHIT